jgi:uncharacterized protein YoxC
MGNDEDRIDEVAETVDDLKRSVEELTDDHGAGTDQKTLKNLKKAVDKAKDATDELEDDLEGK